MKQSESDLQIQVVEYLSILSRPHNFLFFSIPNEGTIVASGGRQNYALTTRLKKMGMLPGVADLCIVQNGKAYFIELKTKTGVLSENQKLFRKRVWECYGEYEVCHSIEEVKECLEIWGVVK